MQPRHQCLLRLSERKCILNLRLVFNLSEMYSVVLVWAQHIVECVPMMICTMPVLLLINCDGEHVLIV